MQHAARQSALQASRHFSFGFTALGQVYSPDVHRHVLLVLLTANKDFDASQAIDSSHGSMQLLCACLSSNQV